MTALPKLDERLLRPYVSALLLVLPEHEPSVHTVWEAIRDGLDVNDQLEIVADDLQRSGQSDGAARFDEVRALAFCESRLPAWGRIAQRVSDQQKDRTSHLVVLVRQGPLVAVHSTAGSVHDHIRRLVHDDDLGGAGLLAPEALQSALLTGEIRTLWMGQGVARRGPGARTKAIGGRSVDVDIDPIGDQRHTLTAARAGVTEDLFPSTRQGSVGTALERSTVWFRRARSRSEFTTLLDELFGAINRVIASGGGQDRFAVFAKKTTNLASVSVAYELSFEEPELNLDDAPSDRTDVAVFLENCVVDVEPAGQLGLRARIADEDGVTAVVRVVPRLGSRRRVSFDDIGVESGDELLYERFRSSFERADPIVYYASGHAVTRGGVVSERLDDVPFSGWTFDAFLETDVRLEKPAATPTTSGRDLLRAMDADSADSSLFGWVLRRWPTGWLYCDDGADELCDFVHLDPQAGEVRVIHVKAAGRSGRRNIASVPYEQVCAQVQKNLSSLTRPRLAEAISARAQSEGRGPLWFNGRRSDLFDDFVAALLEPRAAETYTATIVQPHVSDRMLQCARAQRSATDAAGRGTTARLRRLEHLLVATAGVASRVAARLEVIAHHEDAADGS